jgi:uncharacterized peroxidase-related enzyme
MAYIQTITEDQAEGLVKEQYEAAVQSNGYIQNYLKAFSLRPEVYDAWQKLISAIRSKMRLRRYELVTFSAAMALKCNYCMQAHAAVLRKNLFSAADVVAILKDFRQAGLSPQEVAVMAFAQKVIFNAYQVSEGDIQELREQGLSDEEIFDVVAATTARSFFSKTLDALGAEPDEVYQGLEPELLEAIAARLD